MNEEYIATLDKQDKKRAEEAAAWEEKIHRIMDKMSDVFKQSDVAEKEFDRKII